MAYGITMENDGNELTLTDQGITYSYIGKAVNTAVSQASATDNGSTTYQIDWPGKILVALQVQDGVKCTLLGYSQSGNTWTIGVCSGNGNTSGFEPQVPIDVYVFGSPSSYSSTYGLALYNDSGTMVSDLTRPPLTFTRFYISDPAGSDTNTNSYAIPANIIKPAVIGYPTGKRVTSVASGNFWIIRTFFTGWTVANGRIYAQWIQSTYDGRADGGAQTISNLYPSYGLLIDASKY